MGRLKGNWTVATSEETRSLLRQSPFTQMLAFLQDAPPIGVEDPLHDDFAAQAGPEPVGRRHSHASYYTVAQIVLSLQACREQDGLYPTSTTGIIAHGPLANGTRTWLSVDKAIDSLWRKKDPVAICNSLTRSNCPHRSLSELKQAYGLDDRNYSFKDVIASYRRTWEKTGLYPTQLSGLIEHGPLANGRRKWGSVDKAMNHLWRDGHENVVYCGMTRAACPTRSLAEFRGFFAALLAREKKNAAPREPE